MPFKKNGTAVAPPGSPLLQALNMHIPLCFVVCAFVFSSSKGGFKQTCSLFRFPSIFS